MIIVGICWVLECLLQPSVQPLDHAVALRIVSHMLSHQYVLPQCACELCTVVSGDDVGQSMVCYPAVQHKVAEASIISMTSGYFEKQSTMVKT